MEANTTPPILYTDPALASIKRLQRERMHDGRVSPEVWQRVIDEEASLVAEGLRGHINIPFDFKYIEGKLRAEDGEDFIQIAQNGIEYAYQQSIKDSRYDFLVQRAVFNYQEAQLAEQLAAGDLQAKTIIIVEPYAEEQAAEYGEQFVQSLGFRPDVKLALVRAIEKTDDGVRMYTRGVEQSDLALWNKVLGKKPPIATTTQMVGEHMVTNAHALHILDALQADYISRAGGEQANKQHDVWNFLQDQKDLSNHFYAELDKISYEQLGDAELKERVNFLRYNYWSALRIRFEAMQAGETFMENANAADVMHAAGAKMQAEREIFAACGVSITPISELSIEQMANELFGSSGNILRCVTCPYCKQSVDAKLDKGAGTIECLNSKCGAKVNTSTGERLDNRTKKKKPDFGDILVAIFFGSEADIVAKKRVRLRKRADESERKVQHTKLKV